jgi:hypothetical protein
VGRHRRRRRDARHPAGPPTVRGEALGVYAALSALAGGAGSVLGGWLAGLGYLLGFGVAGGLVAVAGGVVLAVRRRSRPPATGADAATG